MSPLTTAFHGLQAAVLETVLNQLLVASPDLQSSLTALDGKTIQLHIKDLQLRFYFKFAADSAIILREYNHAADVQIESTLGALINLALQKEKMAALRAGDIRIEGDVQTARQLETILNPDNIDWEELLAKHLGDLPAYNLMRCGRQLQKEGARLLESLRHSTRDYLQEEARYLPTRIEIENHCRDINELRLRSDRLNARYERLLEYI